MSVRDIVNGGMIMSRRDEMIYEVCKDLFSPFLFYFSLGLLVLIRLIGLIGLS